MLKPITYLGSFPSRFCVVLYAWPLSITIVIYILICRKLWLRKILGNVTTTNRAAAQTFKLKVVRLLVVIAMVFAICWFPSYVDITFGSCDLKFAICCRVRYSYASCGSPTQTGQ